MNKNTSYVLKDGEKLLRKAEVAEAIEHFSPPIFAAYCSKNGMVCIERLPQFLVGIEMIFLINLIRKATKEHIRPLIVRMQKPIMDDIRRLSELEKDDSYRARVQSALTELLPGGKSGMDEVAKKLGMSKRTLQRKLQEEER